MPIPASRPSRKLNNLNKVIRNTLQWSLLLAVLVCGGVTRAQNPMLAQRYFDDGEFDKAVVIFEQLYRRNKNDLRNTESLIACYQQLERFGDAERILLERTNGNRVLPVYQILLGYNYSLQGKEEEAERWFEAAISQIDQQPGLGYGIGYRFQRLVLLDKAEKSFLRAMELNPELDYSYQLANIYGEQGRIEDMFNTYLDMLQAGKGSRNRIMQIMEAFLGEEPQDTNNQLLRRLLLKKAQKQPDLIWNELLSWLFALQGQFEPAFTQEKAIYRRSELPDPERIMELALQSSRRNQGELSREMYRFVIEEEAEPSIVLEAELNLLDLLQNRQGADYEEIRKSYQRLLEANGISDATLRLLIQYGRFLSRELNDHAAAIRLLDKGLAEVRSPRNQSLLKMEKADIWVVQEEFNRALLLYSQVQLDHKNQSLGQEARFRVAKTSFYKGDFEWAFNQLKVLRGSSSQLMANDAMQLSLLISDNLWKDSTEVYLAKYARAELLSARKRNPEAVRLLSELIEESGGQTIQDEALYFQGQLLERLGRFQEAADNYQKIIEGFSFQILADDARYALGLLYQERLGRKEAAMEQFQYIIFNYPDSYYYPLARKRFRRLRGDDIE